MIAKKIISVFFSQDQSIFLKCAHVQESKNWSFNQVFVLGSVSINM